MGSFSEKSGEEHSHLSIDSRQVDTGAQLVAGVASPLDPNESLRIRRKIDRHILPLMCILYWYVHSPNLMARECSDGALGSSSWTRRPWGALQFSEYSKR
ncbi:hypothetical protein BJV78DRAFT_256164 [Lactifluus subvellereus]|nr:hypothetical protein BJV78DRAFT_256164 [Lactifluus subvellereus]